MTGALLIMAGMLGASSEVSRCLHDSENAQQWRDDGKLLDAQAGFIRCAANECPNVVRADCGRWLEEVRVAVPTIVVVVQEGDREIVDGRLSVDGKPLGAMRKGLPIEIDPGEHLLRLERDALPPKELAMTIFAGEKNRKVVMQLGERPSRVTLVPRGAEPAGPGAWLPVALTAIAGAGALTFGILGATGESDLSRLKSDPCAMTHTCDPGRVRDTYQKLLAADISLAVSIVAIGFAAWRWWAWADSSDGTSVLIAGRQGALRFCF